MTATQDKVKELLNSQHVKDMLPYLLAGAGGAVAGGAMTGKRRSYKGESRLGYLGRILRNAAVTGGLAAGGTALINKGINSTVGAVDKKNPISGSTNNEGPLSTLARGLAFSPSTAAVAGITGLAATHNRPGLLGAGHAVRDKSRGLLAADLGLSKDQLDGTTPRDVHNRIQAHNTAANWHPPLAGSPGPKPVIPLETLRSRAGIAYGGDSKVWRVLSTLANKGPLSTLGTTTGRRLGRGALGLAFAGLPALAGALATDDPTSN